MTAPSRWWNPQVHADRRPVLMMRGRVVAGLRAHFATRDFIEVETAALQVSPGNETHLRAFSTQILGPDGHHAPLHLHTSPEFACKKLLAAGETSLVTFARVFRNGERSALHHPEFTMLEWYRAGADYRELMDDCAALVACAAEHAGTRRLDHRGRQADPFAAFERLTLAQAFADYARIDLFATMAWDGATDRAALADAVASAGLRVAHDDTWSDLFSRVLVAKIEPHLGIGRPTILYEYPASEAALARRSLHDPRVAERFELYACGVELANAFGELTDPVEQRCRFEAEMAEKARIYGDAYPIDEEFIAALALMPEASGVALGLDRLIMLLAGAPRIEDVIWTPVAEPRPC